MELYNDEFGTITYDGDRRVLAITWSVETKSLTPELFREWLERFAGFGESHDAPYRLIDVREFGFRPDAEFGKWRDANIIPRYNASGVTKFAFLLPTQAPDPAAPAVESPAAYPTGYFKMESAMATWFAE